MNTPPRAWNSATALTPIHHTMNEATATVVPAPQEIKLTPAQEARFWAKVNKAGPTMPGMASACWVWTAGKNNHGYGQLRLWNKPFYAHRVAWTLANGSIPRGDGYHGTCVLHRCDNPACCRVDHLFRGTHTDNMRDKTVKGRHGSRTKPDRIARGDRNGARLHPERMSRGDTHYARLHPERLAHGEANGSAKLTASKVLDIRARYAAGGITQRLLGSHFGVSQSVIGDIIRRNIWRHIP